MRHDKTLFELFKKKKTLLFIKLRGILRRVIIMLISFIFTKTKMRYTNFDVFKYIDFYFYIRHAIKVYDI